MFRRSLVIAGLAALAVGVVSDSALAQFYRGKTITMIINYRPADRRTSRGASSRSICPRTFRANRRSSSGMWAAPAA